MKTTTLPASRFGWEGQTVEYTVRADGATELVAPATCPDGLKVRVLDSRRVGEGLEARVAVAVAPGTLY